jgi:hypothetical protein
LIGGRFAILNDQEQCDIRRRILFDRGDEVDEVEGFMRSKTEESLLLQKGENMGSRSPVNTTSTTALEKFWSGQLEQILRDISLSRPCKIADGTEVMREAY